MIKYWANAIGRLSKNSMVSLLITYDAAHTLEKAKEAITTWQVAGDVYYAWIEDDSGNVVWHECFIDTMGYFLPQNIHVKNVKEIKL